MVVYTLAELPDQTFSVRGKDSEKARQQAMEQLHQRIENEEIPSDAFPNGVDPSDFIEVDSSKMSQPQVSDENNEVLQAVQTLSNLALLKIDLEKDRQAALEVYDVINRLLFGSEPVEEEEIDSLKQGFKTLKVFAQNHIKLQSSLPQAESARDLLNQALYGESATVEKGNSSKSAKAEKTKSESAKGDNGRA